MELDPYKIVDIIIRVYVLWRDYLKETKKDTNKEVFLQECPEFVKDNFQELKDGNSDLLLEIHRELIHKGELKLAQKVNSAIYSLIQYPEGTYIILESYLESEKFYNQCKL